MGLVSGQVSTFASGPTRRVGARSACLLGATRFWGTLFPPAWGWLCVVVVSLRGDSEIYVARRARLWRGRLRAVRVASPRPRVRPGLAFQFQQVSRDCSLTPAQKKQCLHNLLHGDAKRFFQDRIERFPSGRRNYNSPVRQNRAKNHLNGIRLRRFTNQGLEESTALEKVYKLMTKLDPQVPQSHIGSTHKVEFLRSATVGLSWTTETSR